MLFRNCFKTHEFADERDAKDSKEAIPWHSRLFPIVTWSGSARSPVKAQHLVGIPTTDVEVRVRAEEHRLKTNERAYSRPVNTVWNRAKSIRSTSSSPLKSNAPRHALMHSGDNGWGS